MPPLDRPPATPDVHVEPTGDAAARYAHIGFILGPLLFLAGLFLPPPEGLSPEGMRVAAVALWMAVWWMTEAIPLAATALLPLVLFPALRVLPAMETAGSYGDEIIFLFLGGFCIALAMQRWGLHRRLALAIVDRVGTEPRRLVLGLMLATYFTSMWISNTATTAMMLPIGIAILAVVEQDRPSQLGGALTLAIAYAATIGGIATLIGTAPNAIFAAAASRLAGRTISFFDWLLVGLPLSAAILAVVWWVLAHLIYRLPARSAGTGRARALIRAERRALGAFSLGEKATATVFVLTALGWLLRERKELGFLTIPGLSDVLPMIRDSSIAVAGALVLFLFPVSWKRREFALDWEWAKRLPWDVLLLFGGGLALARAFTETGLDAWIGNRVGAFGQLHPFVLLTVITVVIIGLSEIASNTATATMSMPIMVSIGAGTNVDPVLLMATAAVASSMSFMLPVSTPPNAIVYASGRIRIPEMVRAGVWIDLIGAAFIPLAMYFVFAKVFGIGF